MSISDRLKNLSLVDGALYPSFEGKTLSIEIVRGCNEKCIYCPYYANGLHKKERTYIDEKLFKRVTKEAYDLGVRDIGLYMNAEPLLNPKVYEYVEYLKHEVGYEYTYISTNGLLLNKENLEKLVNAGIDSIKFSVSGADKDSFYRHHGVDAFDLVYNNIKYAYEYRKRHNLGYKLYMFSIITNYNCGLSERFKEIYGPYVDELVLYDVLSNHAVKGIKEYLVQGKNQNNSINVKIPCEELFNRIAIDEDGYLVACCHNYNEGLTRIQDLSNTSLKDAIYSDSMTNLRRMHLEHNIDGTICDFCVNGNCNIEKKITTEIPFRNVEMKRVDVSEEIRKRFGIN